ncbi:hypothetical protein FB45DRAFT_949635 [Roridomyces roridus]|uniref:CFEM domain-containing protein n=1 Tax=Roridomyces roridus TaxID=1738132 RepID=A0AAD7B0B8_9AGAR|nr:hypothetical protein FB45DRAFT_949635 [Roridomyces roridus]
MVVFWNTLFFLLAALLVASQSSTPTPTISGVVLPSSTAGLDPCMETCFEEAAGLRHVHDVHCTCASAQLQEDLTQCLDAECSAFSAPQAQGLLFQLCRKVSSPSEPNTSAKMMFNAFTTEGSKTGGGQWANVKDSRVHLLAITRDLPEYVSLSAVSKAEGKNVNRFIIGGLGYAWQDMLDAAPASAKHYQKGVTGSITSRPRDMDNRRAQEVLGIRFTSIQDTVKETLEDYEAKGCTWVKA